MSCDALAPGADRRVLATRGAGGDRSGAAPHARRSAGAGRGASFDRSRRGRAAIAAAGVIVTVFIEQLDLRHDALGRIGREPYRRQLVAPHAARIEAQHVVADHQAECGPMAEHHRHVLRAAPWHVVPRHEAGRRRVRPAIVRELHRAVGRAEADARQRVVRHAQAIDAGQRIVPAMRLVAVQRRRASPSTSARAAPARVRGRVRASSSRPIAAARRREPSACRSRSARAACAAPSR